MTIGKWTTIVFESKSNAFLSESIFSPQFNAVHLNLSLCFICYWCWCWNLYILDKWNSNFKQNVYKVVYIENWHQIRRRIKNPRISVKIYFKKDFSRNFVVKVADATQIFCWIWSEVILINMVFQKNCDFFLSGKRNIAFDIKYFVALSCLLSKRQNWMSNERTNG